VADLDGSGLDPWTGLPDKFVHLVLDRRDRNGRFPNTITVSRTDPELRTLETRLPPNVMRKKSNGRLQVNLARWQQILDAESIDHGYAPTPLESRFDARVGREPKNLSRDREGFRATVLERIAEGIELGRERSRRSGHLTDDPRLDRLAADWHERHEAGRGTWARLAGEAGMATMTEALAVLVAAFLIAITPRRKLLLLDQLSLMASGNTKTLRPGTSGFRRLAEALMSVTGELPETVRGLPPDSKPVRKHLLLDRFLIADHDHYLEVTVSGDVQLVIDGERFTDIGRLSNLGLASKITYEALRASERITTTANRVLSVENETAFRLLRRRRAGDVIVFTGGQATWAAVELLSRLARDRAGGEPLEFFHTGDLDRSGWLILRSLRARSGLDIRPIWMDAETYDNNLAHSLAMSPSEREQTERLLERWNEPFGRDVLERLVEHGRWIEQEQILALR